MATMRDVLRRMDRMAITDMEAHGLLGDLSCLAPAELERALDTLEDRRQEAALKARGLAA